MIRSSVNLVRFIVRPQVGPDSNRRWRKNPVAGQGQASSLPDFGDIDLRHGHFMHFGVGQIAIREGQSLFEALGYRFECTHFASMLLGHGCFAGAVRYFGLSN